MIREIQLSLFSGLTRLVQAAHGNYTRNIGSNIYIYDCESQSFIELKNGFADVTVTAMLMAFSFIQVFKHCGFVWQ